MMKEKKLDTSIIELKNQINSAKNGFTILRNSYQYKIRKMIPLTDVQLADKNEKFMNGMIDIVYEHFLLVDFINNIPGLQKKYQNFYDKKWKPIFDEISKSIEQKEVNEKNKNMIKAVNLEV